MGIGMGSGPLNLSGKWDGTFAYPKVPEAGPVTPFLATITDSGGVFSGTVIEPNEFADATAHATLAGHRVGSAVHFAKTYHDAGDEYRETVLYFGTISDDGQRIDGEWQIGHWRGPFEMLREPTHIAEVEIAISESV